jgi:hypothetical protein
MQLTNRATVTLVGLYGEAWARHYAKAMRVMGDSISIRTDLFQHRELNSDAINRCCFGEDFAAWLKKQLSSLVDSGFLFSEPIQEDYGWGFWASRGRDKFWVAISYVGDGPQEEPAEWVISVKYEQGLNVINRIFHKPDPQSFVLLRDRIWQILGSNSGITIVDTFKVDSGAGA